MKYLLSFFKRELYFVCIAMFFFVFVQAQDISVPDSILAEMEKKELLLYDMLFEYKIVYPENYTPPGPYPAVLALSGGTANEFIVDFCYARWFRSSYFKDYVIILPIAPKQKQLLDLSDTEIRNFLNNIIDIEYLNTRHWIAAGTSNGGVAALKFALVKPQLFDAVVVMPGAFNFPEAPSAWKHMELILAYGEWDNEWKEYAFELYDELRDYVKKIQIFEMKDQEHILKADYDINKVYQLYFDKNIK